MRLGTALFEYIKHMAVMHESTQLLVLYSTSSPGTTDFWQCYLPDHWAAACGDDNEASRQVPEPLYVSLFNGRDLFLCRRDLDTESEADSLQALKKSADTVKSRLRDKFKLDTDIEQATEPPEELQKGACHRAQPCTVGPPSVIPSPLDAGVLLGWYHAKDNSYFFAEYLKTDYVLENDSSTVARCAAVAANAARVLRPFPPISSSTLQALLAVSRRRAWEGAPPPSRRAAPSSDVAESGGKRGGKHGGKRGRGKYNSFFVVGAAPSEQAFEAQVRLQRFLPRPLTQEERAAAEARKKGPRQRSRPSSAAGVEQRDARRELSFLALCVGTGILQGYLAKLGYTGEMVDDGKCASPQHGALYPRNWWHRERPLDADPFDGLELLSRELHLKGVGQDGGSARRVELKQLDTAELPIEGRKRVDVARPTRAKSRHHLPYCYHHHLPSAHARRLLLCWLGSVAGPAVKPGPLLSAGLARHVLLYPQQDVRCEAPAPRGECLPR